MTKSSPSRALVWVAITLVVVHLGALGEVRTASNVVPVSSIGSVDVPLAP